jgi:hypothetical protein
VPILANSKDWTVQVKSPAALAAVPVLILPGTVAAPVTATAPTPAPSGTPARVAQAAAPSTVAPATVSKPAAVADSNVSAPAVSPAAQVGTLPTVVPLSKEEIESRAKEWMEAAREALGRRNGVIAAARLNQVLSLPPNSQTEAASALMGDAREFSGELRRAAAEYESYLKNYPKGAFTPHVKERLAAISTSVGSPASSARAPATPGSPAGVGLKPASGPATWTVNGGFSQYYYTGNSKIEVITPPPPGQLTFNTNTLDVTDQKSLISSLDLSGRRRDATTDTRVVLRETDNRNYLRGQPSYDRLYAAYVEQTNKEFGYFFRAGRQSGTGAGVLGRFDGLSVGYNLNPSWRVNAVAGNPAEFRDPFRRTVYGASVDYIPQLARPGFSAYYVEQTLDGVKERQAIGTEIRYFDQYKTVFSLFDYDINFKQVNIAMVQANLRTEAGTNYYANLDIRRSPSLGLTTALPGQISQDPFNPTLSFRSLFQTSMNNLGLGPLRDAAAALTSVSSFYTVGFIHPITPRLQLGADYRQANISGTEASGILAAQGGSGTSHIFSGQALVNSLLRTNDAFNANGSYILAPLYDGQNYNVAYILPIDNWRFEGLLGYYYQTDSQSQRQTRWSPSARVVYRMKNRISFELNIGSEIFDETGPLREQHSRRTYIYTGYRLDFN